MFFTSVLVCLGSNISDGEEDKKQESIRLTLDLSDGSHIMGTPTRETIPFQSSLAKMNIPLKAIGSIQFKNDRETVKISFRNGDQLQGVMNLDAIEVTTLFGKVSIDMGHLVSLRVSNGGRLAAVPQDGLLLYYSFDEDEGERVSDKSGKDHHGKVVGAKYIPKGKTGGAYTFDGNAGIHVSGLSFPDRKYTVSGWIRTDRAAVAEDYRMWVGQLDGSGSSFQLFLVDGRNLPNGPTSNPLKLGPNSPYWIVWSGGTGLVSLGAPDANFRDGNWHMATVTYEKEDQRIYADGVLAATSKCAGALPPNSTEIVIGGMDFGPYRHPWIGDIDEVMIFDRVLSADEIRSVFEN